MNTPNNKRRKESRRKIETTFAKLLQNHELAEISVTAICKLAQVNRTTFYANYVDIYDLADAVQKSLEEDVLDLYHDEREQGYGDHDFLRLFRHIKENPLFYKTYFKLNAGGKLRFAGYDANLASVRFDDQHMEFLEYHIEFFRSGLNAVIQKWLQNDCRESPEEIFSIIQAEYRPFVL